MCSSESVLTWLVEGRAEARKVGGRGRGRVGGVQPYASPGFGSNLGAVAVWYPAVNSL